MSPEEYSDVRTAIAVLRGGDVVFAPDADYVTADLLELLVGLHDAGRIDLTPMVPVFELTRLVLMTGAR